MPKKKKAPTPAAVPAATTKAKPAATPNSPFQDWLRRIWERVEQVAARLWQAVQGLCEFARDVAFLVAVWVSEPDSFTSAKLLFKLKYGSGPVSADEVAKAVATALAS